MPPMIVAQIASSFLDKVSFLVSLSFMPPFSFLVRPLGVIHNRVSYLGSALAYPSATSHWAYLRCSLISVIPSRNSQKSETSICDSVKYNWSSSALSALRSDSCILKYGFVRTYNVGKTGWRSTASLGNWGGFLKQLIVTVHNSADIKAVILLLLINAAIYAFGLLAIIDFVSVN